MLWHVQPVRFHGLPTIRGISLINSVSVGTKTRAMKVLQQFHANTRQEEEHGGAMYGVFFEGSLVRKRTNILQQKNVDGCQPLRKV